jgi:aminodeoxyfutalosine deaminase
MFSTDLSQDYEAATELGLDPSEIFAAGVEGALCDDETKSRLRASAGAFDWNALQVP